MQTQKIIKLKNGRIITTDQLIKAAEATLKKWRYVINKQNPSEKCGFCKLMIAKAINIDPGNEIDPCVEHCPAGKICHQNIKFWDEIAHNENKSFNPIAFKYQKQRIQKNIDWLKAYLKELRK